MRNLLQIDLHAFWHAGTGRSRGTSVDAIPQCDPDGLPYLPGRTVAGLLREAFGRVAEIDARRADTVEVPLLSPGLVTALLGSEPQHARGGQLGRYGTDQGCLAVDDARPWKDDAEATLWRGWAATSPDAVASLRRRRVSTAITPDGVARPRTLRADEVVVPMTLYAPLSLLPSSSDSGPPAGWREALEEALPLVRRLGSRRHRGFGRCTVTLLGEGEGS